MADDTKKHVANIFIGLGGSGAETLMRLNSLMAQDEYWRYRARSDLYYVVVDTEAAKLNEFQARVKEAFLGKKDLQPYVETILLSKAYVTLTPAVRQYFVKQFAGLEDESGRDRLREHWWFDADDPPQPFAAPGVFPLSKGAGQCPLVSRFLAWMSMDELDKSIERLLQEMTRRRGAFDSNPWSNNNVTIVSSLAGGTGRGCWELIAFKLRQILRGKNAHTWPVGFFFDQSVFGDVARANPSSVRALRLNSLTGVSELSGWLENKHLLRGKKYQFRLPNLKAPADENMDELNPDFDEDPNEASPTNHAYLIFGGNRQAVLDTSQNAYEMLGMVLYARTTQSAVTGSEINNDYLIGSVGSASFEIPAESLFRYYIANLRLRTANCILKQDDEVARQAAHTQVGATRFDLKLSRDDQTQYEPNEKGDILQQVLAELDVRFRKQMQGLVDALDGQRPQDVHDEANRLVSEDEKTVDEAFKSVVAKIPFSPEKAMGELLEKANSVGTAKRAIEHLDLQWQTRLENLPKTMELADNERLDKVIDAAERRDYWPFGDHFNQADKQTVQNAVAKAYLYANYPLLRERLEKQVKEWGRVLKKYNQNAAALSVACYRITNKFDQELHFLGGAYNADDPKWAVFVDKDRPENGVPELLDPKRAYRRILKPIYDETTEPSLVFPPELRKLLIAELQNGNYEGEGDDRLGELANKLEEKIRSDVALDSQFLRDQYSFSKVLPQVLKAWQKRLKEVLADPDETETLLTRFSQFFGTKPALNGQAYEFPPMTDFISQMAVSLAQGCAPYWQTRADAEREYDETDGVQLFIPDSGTEKANKLLPAELPGEPPRALMPHFSDDPRDGDDKGKKGANPFVMIAYTRTGILPEKREKIRGSLFDRIDSLDYWKEPKLKRWLEMSEDPTGASVFEQSEGNRGVGFVDPGFVREQTLVNCRWRPWAQSKLREGLEEERLTYAGMVYALLDPTPAIATELAKIGWKLPLIRDVGNEQYVFARWAQTLERDKAVPVPNCGWDEEDKVCTSICQVESVLAGRGTTQGTKTKEGKKWRQGILAEAQVFWKDVAAKCGFQSGSDARYDLIRKLLEDLGRMRKKAQKDDADTWDRLCTFVEEFKKADTKKASV